MGANRHHDRVQLLITLAAMVASACSDPAAGPASIVPTEAPQPAFAAAATARPDRRDNIAITSLTISPTALTIGGSAVPGTTATWTATIENPKKQTLSNVLIQGHFLEYLPSGSLSAWRIVVPTQLIQCPGWSPGVLPSGTCTISGTVTPMNDGTGAGLLVPDDATHDTKFRLDLFLDTGHGVPSLVSERFADVVLFYQIT